MSHFIFDISWNFLSSLAMNKYSVFRYHILGHVSCYILNPSGNYILHHQELEWLIKSIFSFLTFHHKMWNTRKVALVSTSLEQAATTDQRTH